MQEACFGERNARNFRHVSGKFGSVSAFNFPLLCFLRELTLRVTWSPFFLRLPSNAFHNLGSVSGGKKKAHTLKRVEWPGAE